MELYAKMSRDNRKKAVHIEVQRCLEALSQFQSDSALFLAKTYELLEKRAAQILAANVLFAYIKNKGLAIALGQLAAFPEFILSMDSHRQLFLLTEESLVPPDSDTFNFSWYWVIALLNSVQFLLELTKAVRSLNQPELERKAVFIFKLILSKNLATVKFSQRIQRLPLSAHFPELRYLIKVLVGLLLREPTLVTPLMDLSTVRLREM